MLNMFNVYFVGLIYILIEVLDLIVCIYYTIRTTCSRLTYHTLISYLLLYNASIHKAPSNLVPMLIEMFKMFAILKHFMTG